jgi:hypothetical protein
MALSEISNPSVSMIIRYGSNIERLLRRITSHKRCAELMKKFELDGKLSEKLYQFTKMKGDDLNEKLKSDKKEEVLRMINELISLLKQVIKESQNN